MLRRYRGILPTLHPSAYIDESAKVIGDVEISQESSVWMDVVIRGDVHRSGTHPTAIGDEVTIGHAAVVHGGTIEDRCLIGMGVVLLNGARVGEDSIVAAGALVTEDTTVPPRSLVMGRPGKVIRSLSDVEVVSILEYARRYVGYRLEDMEA